MGQKILDEANPTLDSLQLKVHALNVEEIRLPDELVADQMTQYLREGNAEFDRRMHTERIATLHKELQKLQVIAERSYEQSKSTGMNRRQRPRYVLRQLLIEMRNQATAKDAWPVGLDELLESIDDVIIEGDESIGGHTE